ncbi:camphor resistance protein CrcB [Stutzerimonas stutzeri]|uniref:Fluoride-specific ion channel FluC n=1 Tax=Stutzerimonas stutzeri TaxID=316 RepID=W8RA60_STUST|nr:fluoride efflux transporter CrcB [Stutzerimonas stutzeri]AHL75292.1 camphor resistance protein CrcB [Stutzerimonas stutzeri]MCQ4328161.1 fluoride efflux transporter CrcB [Stutzerimonas stutzeri]
MIRMVLAVVAGGVLGTLIRFGVATWVSANWPRHFYLATLGVNLLGCLLIGYLYAFFLARPEISPELRGGLIIGFLGALTTFSSFSLDGLRLLESGQLATTFGYVGISVLGGLLAAWAGLTLGRL